MTDRSLVTRGLFSEVVGAVQGVFGLTVDDASETVIDGNPNRPTVISPAAYKKEFGWQPPSLENGLQRYADALQQ